MATYQLSQMILYYAIFSGLYSLIISVNVNPILQSRSYISFCMIKTHQGSISSSSNILVIANTSLSSQFIRNLTHIITNHSSLAIYSTYLELSSIQNIHHIQSQKVAQLKWSLVIVFGNNELLMETFSYFNGMHSPPIIAISHGMAPTLYYYTQYDAQSILKQSIEFFINQEVKPISNESFLVQPMMKMMVKHNCEKLGQATCQIEIHRGMKQSILILNIFLETKEKTKIKICQFKGDGLLISTPMGSYCKSLSYNGPVMASIMQNIMITPICPLSMRFRPLCLSADAVIFIQIDPSCRSEEANMYLDDNMIMGVLYKGQSVKIKKSPYVSNLAYKNSHSCEQLFIKNLKNALNWGENNQHVEIEDIMRKKTSLIEQ